MIIDFSNATDSHLSGADLCIIGSGAAAISLATEFIGRSQRVIMVEGGGEVAEEATTDLYRGHMADGGKTHTGIHEGRARVLGGTTTLWGGQALPLAAIDFEKRDWVAESGWPFTRDDLHPYYPRAGQIMGLRDTAFEEDIHATFGIRRPAFDPAIAECIYSRWAPEPNFSVLYRPKLDAAENITLLLRANVTQIIPDASGTRIDSLELKNLSGLTRTVRARQFVVCCGGIETPRLLLASNRVIPGGIGNRHDLVGRYFQDHLSVRWGDFHPKNRARIHDLYNCFFRGQTKYYPIMQAAADLQRRLRILNISAAVLWSTDPYDLGDGASPLEEAKKIFRAVRSRKFGEITPAAVGKLLLHAPSTTRSAYRVLVKHRTVADSRVPLLLGSTIEQEPNPNSRVCLGSETDALGMPRVRLDWQLTPLVSHTLRQFALHLRDEFHRLDLGKVDLHPWLLDEADPGYEHMHDVYHHIGAARMHVSPEKGVVDPNLKVHGLDNLHVLSSAVFPTGGHSNPTFTLLLLTFRLADHLKLELER